MEFIAGIIAGAVIVGLGFATRQGRSLRFYGNVLVVIALLYVLFAVMAGTSRTIVVETTVALGFVVVAVAALRAASPRVAGLLVAAGLVGHGAYDLVYDAIVSNPVVPAWWPEFCGVADVVLGGWVGLLRTREDLRRRSAE